MNHLTPFPYQKAIIEQKRKNEEVVFKVKHYVGLYCPDPYSIWSLDVERTEPHKVARKIEITYIPGGGYEQNIEEHPVDSAHEQMEWIAKGFHIVTKD